MTREVEKSFSGLLPTVLLHSVPEIELISVYWITFENKINPSFDNEVKHCLHYFLFHKVIAKMVN